MPTTPVLTPEPAAAEAPASYRRLFAVRGLVPLVTSSLLSRTALMMSSVAFALLGLQRFHSASIAGLSIFLLIFPIGLITGYLTRSAGSIFPSSILHAGIDMPVYLGFLSYAT